MSNIDLYINEIEKLVDRLKNVEKPNIEKASQTIADAQKNGNWLYVFGTGHSHMIAEEFFYRAGGMVKIYPIFDTALMLHEGAVRSTALERLNGYAGALLDDYPVKAGDVIIIASNSGRNAVPVEMASEAKKRGMIVIAFTSINHSSQVTSRHSSGKRLFEMADIVIDNGGVFGDACIDAGHGKVAPTSTAIGATVINAIVARVAEILIKDDAEVEFFASSNTDEGEKLNQKFIDKYKDYVRSL
ncbi:MAG TPA: SIS domain-containing protein [Victivallales bacterium]|nr:SIS domain-containing protein [Victivallales bacterium]